MRKLARSHAVITVEAALTKPVLLALQRAVWLAIGSRMPKRKIVRLTPVSPATWLMLVGGLAWGCKQLLSMHLWPDMCPCQEERDARHVAATMEEVAAAMDASTLLDLLVLAAPSQFAASDECPIAICSKRRSLVIVGPRAAIGGAAI